MKINWILDKNYYNLPKYLRVMLGFKTILLFRWQKVLHIFFVAFCKNSNQTKKDYKFYFVRKRSIKVTFLLFMKKLIFIRNKLWNISGIDMRQKMKYRKKKKIKIIFWNFPHYPKNRKQKEKHHKDSYQKINHVERLLFKRSILHSFWKMNFYFIPELPMIYLNIWNLRHTNHKTNHN